MGCRSPRWSRRPWRACSRRGPSTRRRRCRCRRPSRSGPRRGRCRRRRGTARQGRPVSEGASVPAQCVTGSTRKTSPESGLSATPAVTRTAKVMGASGLATDGEAVSPVTVGATPPPSACAAGESEMTMSGPAASGDDAACTSRPLRCTRPRACGADRPGRHREGEDACAVGDATVPDERVDLDRRDDRAVRAEAGRVWLVEAPHLGDDDGAGDVEGQPLGSHVSCDSDHRWWRCARLDVGRGRVEGEHGQRPWLGRVAGLPVARQQPDARREHGA